MHKMMSYSQWMNAKASLNTVTKTTGVFIKIRLRLAGLALSVLHVFNPVFGHSPGLNKMNTPRDRKSAQIRPVAAIWSLQTERPIKKEQADRPRARAYPQLQYKVMYNYLDHTDRIQEAMPCFR